MLNTSKLKSLLQAHKKQGFMFLCVGGFTAALYFAMFTVFWQFMHLNETLAVSLAYIISVLVHFSGNRYLTFNAGQKELLSQVTKYILVTAVNYLITLLVVYCIVDRLEWSPYLAIALSIMATMVNGYVMARTWIFSV